MYGEIGINAGDILTIEEDVLVNFIVDSTFVVDGSLVADSVLFNVEETSQWQGLQFNRVL